MIALKIPHDALILVGDGEKALFLRNAGDETYPNLTVERLFEHDNPPTREKGTDRPGRMSAPGNGPRSSVENADWHTLEKEHFARTIADQLNRLAHAGRFEQLVIVAPPATLGNLRSHLHREVQSRVIAEVDKTLTQHPVHEIERLLTRH
jgi:protein required for attachment to host cells